MNNLLNPRIANIRYAATVMIILAGVLICVILSVYQAVDDKSSDMNYNVTVSLNGYLIKVANAEYDSETKLFEFDLYHKSKSEVKASAPEIYSIASSDDLNTFREYTTEPINNNEYGVHFIVKDVPAEAEYVRIFLSSTTPSYTLPDKTDDFGNVIKGEMVAEDTEYVEIIIDMKSANQEKISPEGIISDIDKNIAAETTTASSTKNSSVITSASYTTISSTVSQQETTEQVTEQPASPPDSDTVNDGLQQNNAPSYDPPPAQTAPETPAQQENTTPPIVATTASTNAYVAVHGLKISCPQASNGIIVMTPNSEAQLTPIFTPENATNKQVTWNTTDANVAVVSPQGTVTAISGGSCIIKCATTGGEYFEVGIMIKVQ